MDWYSIALAGASGGLAALIASLIIGRSKEKRGAFAVVFVGLFFLLNTLSKTYILPEISTSRTAKEIDSAFEELPLFSVIKEHDPKTYTEIVSTMKDSLANGESRQVAIDRTRAKMTNFYMHRLPNAPDPIIIDTTKMIVDQIDEALDYGQESCYRFLFPEVGGGIAADKVFSAAMLEREANLMAELVKNSTVGRDVPSESSVSPLLETTIVGLYDLHGDDASLLDQHAGQHADKERACIVFRDFYKEILALPSEDSAIALRYLYAP